MRLMWKSGNGFLYSFRSSLSLRPAMCNYVDYVHYVVKSKLTSNIYRTRSRSPLYFGVGLGKAEIKEVYRSVLAVEDILVLIYSTALL